MKRQKERSSRGRGRRAGLLALGLLASGACGGCWMVDNCSTIPPGAMPALNGTYVHQFQEVQAAKAEASDFVVFLDEWYMGGIKLGPHGQYHINHMAARLPDVPFPVVIQPCGDPALNETRRQVVVESLIAKGIVDADPRTIIAYPEAEGIRGVEAERAYYDMIYSSRRQGLYNQGYGAGQGVYGGAGLYGANRAGGVYGIPGY